MLPRDLQFELKPRRALPWLKPVVAVTCLLLAGVLLTWLVPRHELDRLRDELDQLSRQSLAARQPAPASGPAPAWQTNAEQDGKLFALTADARLLEVERCTDSTIRVRRLQLDEATGDTSVEIEAEGRTRLDALVECLTGPQATRRWRIASVEVAQEAGASGLVKVMIRR